MAGGVNKVILIGNLGADPEVRYTPSGQAVTNFKIATTETWNDKAGQRQERTEWHRIVAWGKTAELCGEYLSKGRQVYIEGKLQTREWMDKENKKNWTTEIVSDRVVFLSDGRGQAGQGQGRPQRGAAATGGPGPDDFGPPAGYDDGPAPSGGGRSQSSGGGGGAPGGGPSEDDIPF